jgi:hypothetical protein
MAHEHDSSAPRPSSPAGAILELDNLGCEPLDKVLRRRGLLSADPSKKLAHELASRLVRREDVRLHV